MLLAPAFAVAQAGSGSVPSPYDPEAALNYSQKAIGTVIGDYAFRDRRGREVRLSTYRGRPLVINFVYTACTDVCPLIVQTLARAVETAQDALGRDSFAVVTIGFDAAHDTPKRMRAYARSQGIDLPNWTFLSTDEDTARALAEDIGFIYYPSPKGFDHLAQVSVIDADGRVAAQVYGDTFEPPALVEPLKSLLLRRQLARPTLDGLIERVRLFCTLYDPATGRYRFDYSLFVGLTIGAGSLLTVGFILVRALLRQRRMERQRRMGLGA